MELACHYHTAAAEDVGGDFYDVFALDPGGWGFFLGDVCGKGAEAAALTSLTRYTLRAEAHHTPRDPVAVLEALNTALLGDPTVGTRFCTLLYGTARPRPDGTIQVHLAGGGHPPALHLTPTTGGPEQIGAGAAEAWPVELTGGMLVGIVPEAHFVDTTLTLAPGGVLLLYTDGITEARIGAGELLDTTGLATALTHRSGPLNAQTVIAHAVELLCRLSAGVRDDVALLALGAATTTPTLTPSPSDG